ncbi:MAG TPA: hypothetical protein VIK59_04520 [Verrucomicrobiae bacterium]
MKNLLSILIALSVGISVICGAVLLKQKQNAAAVANPANGAKNGPENSPGKNPLANENAADPNSQLSAGKFSWLNLQTDDLKEFVRRLRAVNCPEPTVQDLVLAEVNRRYGKKESALWPDRFSQNAYWKPYNRKRNPEEIKKNRAMAKQQRALQKEKTALLVDLLGVDIEKQHYAEEGIDTSTWNNGINNLSFLPEAKRDAVQKYLDDFSEKEQDFYTSVSGAWDGDARAKQKALEQEKFAGLAQILTPDELRQYELRNSQTASQLASDLRGVSLTEQQYEALYDVRAKYGDSIYNWSDEGNDPSGAAYKQIEQNKKDMQAEIATALGADTSQQLARAGLQLSTTFRHGRALRFARRHRAENLRLQTISGNCGERFEREHGFDAGSKTGGVATNSRRHATIGQSRARR